MQIMGIEGMTPQQLRHEIAQGGRFVVYQYCISIIILTFRQPSSIYFVRPGESALRKSLGFTLVSLLLGWWGIPWGPIYTIGSVATNLGGGKDVTAEVMRQLLPPAERELAPV